MKKFPKIELLIAIVTLLFLLSIFGLYSTMQIKNKAYSMSFGYFPVAGLSPILVAQEKGFFEQEGLNVSLVSFGTQPQNIIPAIVSGNLDGGYVSINRLLTSVEGGMKIKCVASAEVSIQNNTGMLNLAVSYNSNISSVQELKGKKVALLPGGPEEYVLDLALRKYNMSRNDVTIVNADLGQRVLYLRAGDVDAAIITGTSVPKLQNEKTVKILVSFGDLYPNASLSAITFSEDFIKNNPEALIRFLKAYYKASKFVDENHGETAVLISNYLNIDPKYLETMSWPYFPKEKTVPSREEITQFANWLKYNGYINQNPAYEDVVYVSN